MFFSSVIKFAQAKRSFTSCIIFLEPTMTSPNMIFYCAPSSPRRDYLPVADALAIKPFGVLDPKIKGERALFSRMAHAVSHESTAAATRHPQVISNPVRKVAS